MGGQHQVLAGTLGDAIAVLLTDDHVTALIGLLRVLPAKGCNRRELHKAPGTASNRHIQAVAHTAH
ncbi:hypothetical protein D3C80_2121210 [compost metagenome]